MPETNRCCELVKSPSFHLAFIIFLTGCIQMGVIKSIGICLRDIVDDLRTTSTDIGTALGLYSAFSFIPAPSVTVLYRQRPLRRPLLICGSCLVSLGVLLLSMATHKILIGVFLSISGLGTCVLITASSIALNDLASPYFNLIYCFAFAGFGIGMVLMPLLAEILRNLYGWRGAMLILGGLSGHIIPSTAAVRLGRGADESPCVSSTPLGDGAVSRNHSWTQDDKSTLDRGGDHGKGSICKDVTTLSESDSEYGETTAVNIQSVIKILDHKEETEPYDNDEVDLSCLPINCSFGACLDGFQSSDFYHDPPFNCIFLAIFLGAIVYCGWHSFLIPHALQRGFSITDTLLITLSAAICNMTIRVVVAILSNTFFSPISLYVLLTVLNMAALLCDAFLPNFYVMIVTSSVSACALAGRAVLSTLAARERASEGTMDVVFALDYLCYGGGTLLGGYLSGMIADVFQTYDAIFKLLAGIEGLILVAGLMPWIIKKPSTT